MIVDTHVHVVAPDEARFPLRPSGVGSQWFREHPVTAEEYLATATAAGVDRAVLVQAHGAYGSDNAYVLDALRVVPERWVGVVIVDPADADAVRPPARARRSARDARACACSASAPSRRPGSTVTPAPRCGTPPSTSTSASSRRCSRPTCRASTGCWRDIPACRSCSTTAGSRTCTAGPSFPGLEPLLALAEHPGLHLKVTSHVLEGAGAAAGAFVERLVATFGAARLVWGSDYPQTHDRPYAELVALGRDACARPRRRRSGARARGERAGGSGRRSGANASA